MISENIFKLSFLIFRKRKLPYIASNILKNSDFSERIAEFFNYLNTIHWDKIVKSAKNVG